MQAMFNNDPGALAATKLAPHQALVDTAKAQGMTPAQLAGAIATRDVATNADTIMKYAHARGGISPYQAAGELGEIAASQNYVNAESYDKARGITGEEGQIRTRTSENLNEAAKFAVPTWRKILGSPRTTMTSRACMTTTRCTTAKKASLLPTRGR